MNTKESFTMHIRLDPVTHKRLKHICVDLSKSMQEYVYELIKNEVEKTSSID